MIAFQTAAYFPRPKFSAFYSDLNPLNRGFGGSFISDSVYYAERIIVPYEPSVIVFHAGGNDITVGKTPEAVCADFGALVRKAHAAPPAGAETTKEPALK